MKLATIFAAALTAALALPAVAHHGLGRFDPTRSIELEGTMTGLDFVNPHSYVHFDTVGADGNIIAMNCEMRAATVLRRSGWSPDMFVPGVSIVVTGRPHRDDPTSCHVETITLGAAPTLERYQQLTDSAPRDRTARPLRLPSGEPNLAGDWAQEQQILARPPGGAAGLVPISQVAAIEAGELPMPDGPDGWFPPPVTLTEAGRAAAQALRNQPVSENPRLSCQITSILFDWVFDGTINRITQTTDTITLDYGAGLTRNIDLNLTEHPDDVTPSRGGHSIGRWDGDTLVVDTIGFMPGSLAGAVPHSEALHVVERFTLNPETLELKREYVAEDPLYFADQYVDADSVLPADAPFAVDDCKELAFEYRSADVQPETGASDAQYLRLIRDEAGEPASLQAPIVSFEPANAQTPDLRVDLVGAIHVADASFFAMLNERFADYDAVLYELVAPEGANPRPNAAPGNLVSGMQTGLTRLLELSYQLDEVDYARPNFVHADLSPEALARSMDERGESIFTYLSRLMTASVDQETMPLAAVGAPGLIAILMSPDRARLLKVLLASSILDIESFSRVIEGDSGSSLVGARNARAVAVLEERIARGDRRIAIFYGVAHLPDLADRLESGLGLVRRDVSWLDAWDLTASP